MKTWKILLLAWVAAAIFILTAIFDLFHEPVEKIDSLIGKDLDYAIEEYFGSDFDGHYEINTNEWQNEFNGPVMEKKNVLTDSIVNIYTWQFHNHYKTIWVGKTSESDQEIIDAVRVSNGVVF